ncbi:hypothetical protein [Pseudoalteromonas sp. T1lg22]|uniref:hypothetical protein n=1 Tax=Pseudoalteromonas sp. T1lg22 TaxID=2077096 RepID=UPI000CF616E6|nr:hypothetical protein [Pseudoalteromonas sp. T1lg22]
MVTIEIIPLSETVLFKNSANDAIGVAGLGNMRFEYGNKVINFPILPSINTESGRQDVADIYYKRGLIMHTGLVESDFEPSAHGGKRKGAGRKKSEEPKRPVRITQIEKEFIDSFRALSEKGRAKLLLEIIDISHSEK